MPPAVHRSCTCQALRSPRTRPLYRGPALSSLEDFLISPDHGSLPLSRAQDLFPPFHAEPVPAPPRASIGRRLPASAPVPVAPVVSIGEGQGDQLCLIYRSRLGLCGNWAPPAVNLRTASLRWSASPTGWFCPITRAPSIRRPHRRPLENADAVAVKAISWAWAVRPPESCLPLTVRVSDKCHFRRSGHGMEMVRGVARKLGCVMTASGCIASRAAHRLVLESENLTRVLRMHINTTVGRALLRTSPL